VKPRAIRPARVPSRRPRQIAVGHATKFTPAVVLLRSFSTAEYQRAYRRGVVWDEAQWWIHLVIAAIVLTVLAVTAGVAF
jgi:hypothetical protein